MDDLDMELGVWLEKFRTMIKSFWSQWYKTYFNELQRRNKWQEREPNLTSDDIVLIKEDNALVLSWPMGRIVQIYPDKEGIVQNYDIRTSTGILKRNVTRLVMYAPQRICEKINVQILDRLVCGFNTRHILEIFRKIYEIQGK